MGKPVLACLLASVAVTALAAPAASAKSDLRVTAVGKPPSQAVPGKRFKLSDTVANRGSSRSGRTDTRFYLSSNVRRSLRERRTSRANPRSALSDLLLTGARRVPALAAGERSSGSRRRAARLEIPAGTPAGVYRVLACADDRGRVSESREHDNCRATRRRVTVTVPPSALSLRSEAFADVVPDPPLAGDEAQLPLTRQSACQTIAPKRYRTVGPALDAVKAAMAARAGPDAYAGFRRSAQFKSALGAERAAGGAMFFGQPGAALAALIRAHELQPGDASHLVNAAALATSFGMPSEALAMLDEAARLDDTDHPAMGISRQAVALSNRAHALARVGRYGESLRTAETARAIEPLLKEAQTTAGVATLCAGRPAIALIRRGRKRHPDKDPPLDPSGGRESRLRPLALPTSPEQAVSLAPFHASYSHSGSTAELRQRMDEQQALGRRIAARGSPSRVLNAKLLSAVRAAGNTPRLTALHEQAIALRKKVSDWQTGIWCSGTNCDHTAYGKILKSCREAEDQTACVRASCVPAAKGWNQGWLQAEVALYEKLQEYFRGYSRRASAVAAHIGDPDAYRLAMLAIAEAEQIFYNSAQQGAFFWATSFRAAKDHCVEGSSPAPAYADAPTAVQGSGACPKFVQGLNAVIDFGVANVKVNCSEIELGGSLGSGWIKGFAKLGYEFRTGKTSLFAGAQGAVRAGPLSADFRSGIYATSSAQGIEDIGWRVGPGVKADAGLFEFRASDTVDISFVSAFAAPGT